MDEKKLLSKLLLRRKKYQKKCQKCVNALNKKREVLVCLCVCFSSVYDILVCAMKVFNVFLL